MRRRLDPLGPETRELLATAAVLGREPSLATLAAMAELAQQAAYGGCSQVPYIQ